MINANESIDQELLDKAAAEGKTEVEINGVKWFKRPCTTCTVVDTGQFVRCYYQWIAYEGNKTHLAKPKEISRTKLLKD